MTAYDVEFSVKLVLSNHKEIKRNWKLTLFITLHIQVTLKTTDRHQVKDSYTDWSRALDTNGIVIFVRLNSSS